jgi:tRNA(Ile)-lysidine synthase
MDNIVRKFKETIIKYAMIKQGDLVIAGVSGGPDSLVLLHLLRALGHELAFRVHVAHVDHCLRGRQAEEEACWVREKAGEWGFPCTVTKIDVPAIAREKGLSFEEAGHFVRRRFFLDLRQKIGAQKIALGHQADDQAETILMHFLVGTGLEGLRGIMPVDLPFIRPLLFLKRAEVELYCEENGLLPRRDPSNEDEAYLRNRIRRQVIPWLAEKVNPNLVATLNRTAQIIQQDEDYLQQEMTKLVPRFFSFQAEGGSCLHLEGWDALHPSMQRRLIRYAYQSLCPGGAWAEKEETRLRQGLDFCHVEAVRELAQSKETGKELHLPGAVRAEKGYGLVLFSQQDGRGEARKEGVEIGARLLPIPGELFIPETGQRIITELVNEIKPRGQTVFWPYEEKKEKGLPEIIVRSRRPGDKIALAGMAGTKRLKTLFNEKKVPTRLRDRILLICVENNIVWIPQLKIRSKKIVLGTGQSLEGRQSRYIAITFCAGNN